MKKILALDPSKRCTGWAFYGEGHNQAQHGVWDRIASEYSSRGSIYYALYKHLMEHHQVLRFTHVYAEEPLNLLPGTVQTQAENIWISVGMGAVIEMFCHTMNLKLSWVHQARWRRDFIGRMPRGTKSPDLKQFAMERARQLGFSPRKHDEAEAIGVLTYGCALERIRMPWLDQLPMGAAQ